MQTIVSRTSHQEIITGSAEEVILAPSRQGPQITENTIAAAFAQDPIVAVTSDDLIVTGDPHTECRPRRARGWYRLPGGP
jgi:hypothetical protein